MGQKESLSQHLRTSYRLGVLVARQLFSTISTWVKSMMHDLLPETKDGLGQEADLTANRHLKHFRQSGPSGTVDHMQMHV